MPIYSYRCASCQTEFKESHSMTERMTDCEVCELSDTLVRLPSEFAFFRKEKKEQKTLNPVKKNLEKRKKS